MKGSGDVAMRKNWLGFLGGASLAIGCGSDAQGGSDTTTNADGTGSPSTSGNGSDDGSVGPSDSGSTGNVDTSGAPEGSSASPR